MKIKEYRVTMPLELKEYHIGQLFTISEVSKEETRGGDGVEILKNEAFTDQPLLGNHYSSGQYTKKKYHVEKKLPAILRAILPKTSQIVVEESWDAFPYSKTILTNEYLKKDFQVTIESLYLPGLGDQHNVHNLKIDFLNKREIVNIDIAAECVRHEEYIPECDPAKFKSLVTGRGPLSKGWMTSCHPVMTCYKLVTCEFKWFGLQNKIEEMIHERQLTFLTKFHRHMFCSMDKWIRMTMKEVRDFEDNTRLELDQARASGPLRGSTTEDSTKD